MVNASLPFGSDTAQTIYALKWKWKRTTRWRINDDELKQKNCSRTFFVYTTKINTIEYSYYVRHRMVSAPRLYGVWRVYDTGARILVCSAHEMEWSRYYIIICSILFDRRHAVVVVVIVNVLCTHTHSHTPNTTCKNVKLSFNALPRQTKNQWKKNTVEYVHNIIREWRSVGRRRQWTLGPTPKTSTHHTSSNLQVQTVWPDNRSVRCTPSTSKIEKRLDTFRGSQKHTHGSEWRSWPRFEFITQIELGALSWHTRMRYESKRSPIAITCVCICCARALSSHVVVGDGDSDAPVGSVIGYTHFSHIQMETIFQVSRLHTASNPSHSTMRQLKTTHRVHNESNWWK